ncbi:hypothetical protein BGZ94_006252 [Podila epigama]|nr:hypothetical protein BGZ94_006252 [Podila epigama]
MVVQPRLVRVLLRGRSSWKNVSETDYLVLQHHPRQTTNPFRIITRGFPHYRVAEGPSAEALQGELEHMSQLARASIEGKVTSKKISSWLKLMSDSTVLVLSQPVDPLHGDVIDDHDQDQDHEMGEDHKHPLHRHHGDGYLSDTSYIVSSRDMTDPHSQARPFMRRAISLDDFSFSASVHRRRLHSSNPIPPQLRRKSSTLSSSPPHAVASVHHHHHRQSLTTTTPPSQRSRHSDAFVSPPAQPQPQRGHQVRSSLASPTILSVAARMNEHVEYVPLKDRPHSDHEHLIDEEDQEHEPYLLNRDRRVSTNILPTPDVSPGELSDSSEDIVRPTPLLNGAHSGQDVKLPQQRRHHTYPGVLGVPGYGGARPDNPINTDDTQEVNSWSWLMDSPLLDALVNWIEGPETQLQQKSQEKDKPNPWLDIPLQFIDLLTYPEPDPKTGNKMTLALVRETAFVRQRRRTLLMLTAYTLLVRYCSFDFFLVVLFSSNCAMLFLMKNSGRMNVNMAKRAVRQRVGWAKQWAGSIFKRGGNGNTGGQLNGLAAGTSMAALGAGAGAGGQSSSSGSVHHGATGQTILPGAPSTYYAESIRTIQTMTPTGNSMNGRSALAMAPESSPQLKRRGLFGKKVAANGSHQNRSGSVHTVHGAIGGGGYTAAQDAISVMSGPSTLATTESASPLITATTTTTTAPTKRRFFRRNQSASSSNNNTNSIGQNNRNGDVNSNSNSNITHNNISATIPSNGSTPIQIPEPRQSFSHHTPNWSNMAVRGNNTSLSSVPMTQSQSLPQLQFSPKKLFSPTPVPLSKSGVGLASASELDRSMRLPESSLADAKNTNIFSEPPLTTTTTTTTAAATKETAKTVSMPSTPPPLSGLSQLLNQSVSSTSSSPSKSSSLQTSSTVATLRIPENQEILPATT